MKNFAHLTLLFLFVMLAGCSNETEYAVIDYYGKDTGHRLKMKTDKKKGEVTGKAIMKMNYDSDLTEYFEIPFSGQLEEASIVSRGKINVNTPKMPIKLKGGGWEKEKSLKTSLTMMLKIGQEGGLNKRHPVYQIYKDHSDSEDFYYGYFGAGLSHKSQFSTGRMSMQYDETYLIPIKFVPKSLLAQ